MQNGKPSDTDGLVKHDPGLALMRQMKPKDETGSIKVLYGTELSPTLISNITDSVMDEVKAWQARPLDAVYPIVWFDALS